MSITLLMMLLATAQAAIADTCTGFKWDVTRELALFAGSGVPLSAGKDTASAVPVAIDRLYELTLLPQGQVAFGTTPGKASANEGAYAGLAELRLDVPGNYRIAVDAPLWIDVVANGKLLAPTDFQGQHGCEGPHKIVEFDLTGTTRFALQLSGSGQATVRMTVTRAPARKL
jgi:hypothetical protein